MFNLTTEIFSYFPAKVLLLDKSIILHFNHFDMNFIRWLSVMMDFLQKLHYSSKISPHLLQESK